MERKNFKKGDLVWIWEVGKDPELCIVMDAKNLLQIADVYVQGSGKKHNRVQYCNLKLANKTDT